MEELKLILDKINIITYTDRDEEHLEEVTYNKKFREFLLKNQDTLLKADYIELVINEFAGYEEYIRKLEENNHYIIISMNDIGITVVVTTEHKCVSLNVYDKNTF